MLESGRSEKKKEYTLLKEKEEKIKNTWHEDYSVKYLELQRCKTKNPYESYKSAFIAIDRIKEHEYKLSTDKTVNRFHSVLTLMPSDFRNFLKYDSEELVCLDIRNSQPFFSLNLLKKEKITEIITIARNLNKKASELFYIKSNLPSTYLSSSSIILEESLQRIDNQELERYKNLVLSGTIYDYFEKALKDELGISFPSRRAVKEEFFRVIYSSNQYFGQPGAAPKRVFQKLFPGIYEYFVQLKRLHPDLIPIVLQRWESYAVLQCITKRITKDHPEIPLFTIHDGIATTYSYANLVASSMVAELKALIGYSPILKREELNIRNLKYYNEWRHNQT